MKQSKIRKEIEKEIKNLLTIAKKRGANWPDSIEYGQALSLKWVLGLLDKEDL